MLVNTHAATPTVSTFNLNEPAHFDVTPAMIEKGREEAVSHADQLLRDPNSIIVGNPKGSTTFVQFVDFLCPLSEKMDIAIQALIKANADLRVIYKPYPLRGPTSVYAAKAALAANKQGKYLLFHTALMRQAGDLDETKILALAKSLGMNTDQLQSDMNDASYAEEIKATQTLAKAIGVPGTPALFFAKSNLSPYDGINLLLYMLGQFDQPELQSAVDQIHREN